VSGLLFQDKMGKNMSLQVIHLNEWYSKGKCNPFGKRGSDKKGTEKSGPARKCHRINILPADPGLPDSNIRYRDNIGLMSP
jgi:hypothetical protein